MSIEHHHASTEQLDSNPSCQNIRCDSPKQRPDSIKMKETPIHAENDTLDGDPSMFSVESNKKDTKVKRNMQSYQEPVVKHNRNDFKRRRSIEQPNSDVKQFVAENNSLNPSTSDHNIAQVSKLVANAQTSISGLAIKDNKNKKTQEALVVTPKLNPSPRQMPKKI